MSGQSALQVLPAFQSELIKHSQSEPIDPKQLGYGDNDRPSMIQSMTDGGVGLIRIHGSILRRKSWWYASWPVLKMDLEFLAGNAAIAAAVLDIDCPGGEAIGCSEIGQVITDFPKPIVAVATGYCTSAAYRIACHCDRIIATADSELGGIGTLISVDDYSRAYEEAGIQHFDFATGWAKNAGVRGSSLTAEHQTYLQSWADRLQKGFTESLKHRLTVSQIEALSTGECWGAEDAVRLRLADGISTLGDVINLLPVSPQSFSKVRPQQGIVMQKENVSGAPGELNPVSAVETPGSQPSQSGQSGQAAVSPLQSVVGGTQSAATEEAGGKPAETGTQPVQQNAPETQAPSAGQVPASPVQEQTAASPESPIADTSDQGEQPEASQETEAPATFQQIVDACHGHQPSDAFICRMQREGATPAQVSRAFVDQLVASRAGQSEAAGHPAQKFDVAGSGEAASSGVDQSDPMQVLEAQIDELVKDGTPRQQAARQVIQQNPALLTAYQKANQAMTPEQKRERRVRNNGSILADSFQSPE